MKDVKVRLELNDGFGIEFTNVEEIDSVMEELESIRAELEHRISNDKAKKQRSELLAGIVNKANVIASNPYGLTNEQLSLIEIFLQSIISSQAE